MATSVHARKWRTTAFLAVTIDGYIARANDSVDFLPPPPERPTGANVSADNLGEGRVPTHAEMLQTIDLIVMGRRTYEIVCGMCEDAGREVGEKTGREEEEEKGEKSGQQLAFPWPYAAVPLLILTSRAHPYRHPHAQSQLPVCPGAAVTINTANSIDEAIQFIEIQSHKQIWVDGGVTIRGFLERGLIDEMVLTTVGVMLGGAGGSSIAGNGNREVEESGEGDEQVRGRRGGGLSLWGGLRLENDAKWEVIGCEVLDGMVSTRWRAVREY